MGDLIEKRFQNVKKSKTFRNIIEKFSLDQKSVLDLGCSFGEFLVNFGKSSVGITITKEEVEYGQKHNLDIRYGNVESESLEIKEKFDAIFANNIFEHLYSPHAFLRKSSQYLKPGGILILGVPCIPKITSLMRLKKFQGSLATAHINFFTKDTLVKTVEKGGWIVLAARGFRLENAFFDRLLNPIYPHFYIIAIPKPDFKYSEKRMKELVGYTDFRI